MKKVRMMISVVALALLAMGCGHSHYTLSDAVEAAESQNTDITPSLSPVEESGPISVVGSWDVIRFDFFVHDILPANSSSPSDDESLCSSEVEVLVTTQDIELDPTHEEVCAVTGWPKEAYIETGRLSFYENGQFSFQYEFRNESGQTVTLGKFAKGVQSGTYEINGNILRLTITSGAKFGLANSTQSAYRVYYQNGIPNVSLSGYSNLPSLEALTLDTNGQYFIQLQLQK